MLIHIQAGDGIFEIRRRLGIRQNNVTANGDTAEDGDDRAHVGSPCRG